MSVELEGIKVGDIIYDMVKPSDLNDYITASAASGTYATITSLAKYATTSSLSSYATVASLTALSDSLGTAATKNITISTDDPSGGSDGDIWIKYTAETS